MPLHVRAFGLGVWTMYKPTYLMLKLNIFVRKMGLARSKL